MLTKTFQVIRCLVALVLTFLILLVSGVPVQGKAMPQAVLPSPGSLDASFDGDGLVTTSLGYDGDIGSSVVLQPDGRIIVAGRSQLPSNVGGTLDFSLVRYNSDGSLDTSFDTDGKTTTDFGNDLDIASTAVLQPDGKIIVAGQVNSESQLGLARYNSNGSLDTSFGTDGKVTTDLSPDRDFLGDAVLQPDGKIVVVGTKNASNIAVVRYNNDGSLDATFGTNGIVVSTATGNDDLGTSIALQSDNKIVVGGMSSGSIVLLRFNSDGSPDNSFDGDGMVSAWPGSFYISGYTAIQPDGKILLAGYDDNGSIVITRYNTNGSTDTSFGTGGVTFLFISFRAEIHGIALQPNGKIVLAGYSAGVAGESVDFLLVRLNNNGTQDNSFGLVGEVVTDFGSQEIDAANDVAIQPDGKIILVGDRYTGSIYNLALARYVGDATPTTTVTNTNDSGPGSLRQAIAAAASGDVITFDSSLAGTTITLASTLVIDKDLTIDGSSLAPRIVVSGNNSVTVFLIISPAVVTLDSLVITEGYSPEDAGGIYNDGILSLLNSDVVRNSGPQGAGIRNGGTVNLIDSHISANVGNFGGGMDNRGTLTITGSTVSGNIASQGAGIMNSEGNVTVVSSAFSENYSKVTGGGAIQNNAGTLNISGTTFSDNVATTEGGAILNNFGIAMDVTSSVFFRNSGLFGGGIQNAGSTLNITDSSFVENSSGNQAGDGIGGGIYNAAGSTLHVTNTTFSKNITVGSGGGIVNVNDSVAVLDHTTFVGNKANWGAAIHNNGKMTITSSELSANAASGSGGGIYQSSGFLDMKDSTFSNNSAEADAGGLFIYSSNPTLTNLTFYSNSAKTGTGGGLVNYFDSSPVLDNVVFENNSAVSGGGTSNINSTLTLTNGKFIANSAAKGGGMYSLGTGSPKLTGVTFQGNVASADGGALYNDENSTPSLTNVTFHNNSAAAKGGGVYNYIGSHPSLINVTLSANTAGSGDGVYNDLESNATLINSIVWGNSGGEFTSFMSTPVARYSLVKGGYPGTGNLDQDPLLGPLQDNGGFTQTMALLPGSPAIDAGDNASCPDTDQRGVIRPQGANCDLGAYELFLDLTSPTVTSITRTGVSPTSSSSVGFTVTFSEAVGGVDVVDFALTTAGVVGASITNVSGSGSSYSVTVNTWIKNGTIRLDVPVSTDIEDLSGNPLADLPFTSGEVYTVDKGADTTGVFRPSNGALYLKNQNTSGFADIQINYGVGGDYPVVGDWDGNGTVTIGIYRNGSFYLRNSNTIGFADIVFPFGSSGDQPVAGDWNGDGKDTIGIYRNGVFYLRNSNASGAPDMVFSLGVPGDVGIAGDWNGDGVDTTGVFRPSNGALYLKNTNATGFADIQINYGQAGDKPVTGDWKNDGIDTIGVYRNGTFYLRNSNTIGYADLVFGLGVPGDMPIAGNWDGKP